MRTSETINEIAAALAKAQATIKNPAKNHTNPHFKNKYADLTDGLEVVRPALSQNGIAVIQATSAEGEAMVLHTRLAHSSGQWIEGVYPVCRIGKHQEMGSALTYARRYALFSLVGIAGEDDDGASAADAAPRNQPRNEREPQRPAQDRTAAASASPILDTLIATLAMARDATEADRWAKGNAPVIDSLDEPDWKKLETAMAASEPYQAMKRAKEAAKVARTAA